jgi:hypothetical protein
MLEFGEKGNWTRLPLGRHVHRLRPGNGPSAQDPDADPNALLIGMLGWIRRGR